MCDLNKPRTFGFQPEFPHAGVRHGRRRRRWEAGEDRRGQRRGGQRARRRPLPAQLRDAAPAQALEPRARGGGGPSRVGAPPRGRLGGGEARGSDDARRRHGRDREKARPVPCGAVRCLRLSNAPLLVCCCGRASRGVLSTSSHTAKTDQGLGFVRRVEVVPGCHERSCTVGKSGAAVPRLTSSLGTKFASCAVQCSGFGGCVMVIWGRLTASPVAREPLWFISLRVFTKAACACLRSVWAY